MATGTQKPTAKTGQIALLVGAIAIALAVLAFFLFRSGPAGGETGSGTVKQMKPSARNRRAPRSDSGQ